MRSAKGLITIRRWAAAIIIWCSLPALSYGQGADRVTELIARLKDPDPAVRFAAVAALGNMKAPRAAVPLLDSAKTAWKEGNTDFCLAVVDSLKSIGGPSVQPLLNALKDETLFVQPKGEAPVAPGDVPVEVPAAPLPVNNFFVLQKVADILAEIGEPAIEPLVAALKDEQWHVRWTAAAALGGIADTRAVEPLIVALKDAKPEVRCAAALGLESLRDARAVPALTEALQDSNADLRCNAADALAAVKDPRAVAPLISAMNDKESQVRLHVVTALGEIKTAQAMDALIAALGDKDPGVCQMAARKLQEITGQNFGQDAAQWRQWWVTNKDAFVKSRQ